jgi:hypothetical protein
LHSLARARASFDDPDLVSYAGLAPLMALAEQAGLRNLAAEHVRPGGGCGVNAALKVACLAAGMAAGVGSVEDMDRDPRRPAAREGTRRDHPPAS